MFFLFIGAIELFIPESFTKKTHYVQVNIFYRLTFILFIKLLITKKWLFIYFYVNKVWIKHIHFKWPVRHGNNH